MSTGHSHEVVILGSGFAGSILGMILAGQGYRVLVVERSKHPRFAIGESTTPLTNLMLEQLAKEFELPELETFVKWGSWQKHHPDIPVGLKRGFTFFHHDWGGSFERGAWKDHELLVAASPNDTIADTHWYRPAFDQELARMAVRRGVELWEECECVQVEEVSGGMRLVIRKGGGSEVVTCVHCFDASGTRGLLGRALGLGEEEYEGYPGTQSLFAHFQGVRRMEELDEFQMCNAGTEMGPYPVDDAAVHHVFPGGWIWVLRFNHGVVSAGMAVTDERAQALKLEEKEAAWDRCMERLPGVGRGFEQAKAVTPWVHQRRMPCLMTQSVGRHWTLMPAAVGFVDPMLSTGFPLTLLGIGRLARMTRAFGLEPSQELEIQRQRYAAVTRRELQRVAALVGAMYRAMDDFPRFIALTKLYFTAVTFTETCLRLGKQERCGDEFLLGAEPGFGPGLAECLERWKRAESTVEAIGIVDRFIAPYDVAGLGGCREQRWFGVDFEVLRERRMKVGAELEEVDQMIEKAVRI